MDPCPGYKKPRDRGAAAAQRGRGTEDQLLVWLAAAAGKVPSAHALVLLLDLLRRAYRSRQHEAAEAGSEQLELLFHGRHALAFPQRRRHPRVDIERVLSLRRTRLIVERLLAYDQRGTVRHASRRCLVKRSDDFLERTADVNHAGVARV